MKPIYKLLESSIIIFSVFIISLIAAKPTHSIGIGGFGYGSFYGADEITRLTTISTSTEGYRSYPINLGGGLIIDSNCAADKLFNYRLTIGAGKSAWTMPSFRPEEATMVGLMNIFGFGLVRTESFRLWLGPQLGLNTYALNYERKLRDSINVRYSISNGIASSNININLLERKVEGLFFGPSLGLSLGMNFNFAAPVTLSIEMSARLIYYNGVEARSSIILINSLTVPFVQFSYNSWQSYLKFNLNATIAILYRFDEGFLLKKTEPENK